ncbi:phage terminase large subunit family protein [Pseudomonas schmalbachii]|uniref:Phage terminase large subunit family protein n=1 Tax=Pseudomonas schmalbachii TaxID=2816993 RepID=A0ABS3TKF5_9PSED|nr:terminase gpA endonuclease subunit [Pseudomonas schmalbachii]MBO3274137.1 phage terminase large subunit family protein [Pseudomonas schmalbachii]
MLLERLAQARAVLRPPPSLNLWEWADEYRYLSPEASSKPGRWKTSMVEVARGPMEAVTDPTVHTVTMMCCTQLLKTELILNTIGYYAHQDPAPMVVMLPTVHMGETFSKDRIDPMFRDSPKLRGILPPKRARDGGNTLLHKQFPGGHLTIVGANAPGDLAMRPVRIVLCDEIDKYPGSAGDEGDPPTLLGERAATFWNWKQILTCSPTLEPTPDGRGSRIAISYAQSDMRIFVPACPHCGERNEMLWSSVRWPEGRPQEALYHCPSCEQPWSELERRRAIKAARHLPNYGWIATAPFEGHAGFKVSKLASPWEPVSKLAKKFVKAQRSQELLKVFINTQLAETWKDKGEAPDWQRLYNRREDYPRNVVPAGGLLLFAGVDVQRGSGKDGGWLDVLVLAEGRNRERWVIDHRQFLGDTSDENAKDSPWRKLDAMLEEVWPHAHAGVCMQISALGIDSGDQTAVVYRWAQRHSSMRVRVLKGANMAVLVGAAKPVQSDRQGKKSRRGVKLFMVGQNLIKAELYADLRRELPGPDDPMPTGFLHFPQLDDEFFRQLTGEQLVSRLVKGRLVSAWEPTRLRVEALDDAVYARAAAYLHGVDRYTEEHWLAVEESLGISRKADSTKSAAYSGTQHANGAGEQQPERRRSRYWDRER